MKGCDDCARLATALRNLVVGVGGMALAYSSPDERVALANLIARVQAAIPPTDEVRDAR